MIEAVRTLDDDERDVEPERQFAWRAASVGLAVVEVDDAELLHGWRSDPVGAYELGTWPRSLTALRERIERDNDDDDRDDFLVLLPDGTPVGQIALGRQDMIDGTAEVELMLAPQYRGRGHGTDALDALVDLAFGELPLYRLTAETHTGNAPARAVLTKSGFVQEGVSRAACFHRGRRHDLAVFSLLRPEWEALNRPRAWDA
ncbi:GNAT family N-acetyltransferase [Streptomyces sp. NPDC021080]|uniref:GNAT family N-acetyltransferase n=1 Tax=Streptomyces sp. NPDC021080 TaxID=3365110 RepID=UPI0037ABF2E7